jgi:uncharacterized protein (DUF2384 family)
MSDDTGLAARPKQRAFTKRGPHLSPDVAARQGRIVGLACSLLGSSDKAMSFLNTHNESLGARPLDLAMSTAAGYLAVDEAIRRLADASK